MTTSAATTSSTPGPEGYEYRVRFRHYDGRVSDYNEAPVSLEFACRAIARADATADGREWWIERRPVHAWERVIVLATAAQEG
jgi:hypothetical protein